MKYIGKLMLLSTEIELLTNSRLHDQVVEDAVLNAGSYIWIGTANLKDMHIRRGKRYKPISKKDKDVILDKINIVLDELTFSTKERKETQKKFWKKLLGKSFLTKREAYILMGLFKKINDKLKKF